MIPTISLTESQTLTALRGFLLSVLPSGVECVRGQNNRVAEPPGTDFVVMTPILRERLETNIDAYLDAAFTGSIALTVLTVSQMQIGSILTGAQLLGINVAANTVIQSQLTGTPGGAGTYQLSVSQTLSSQTLAAGTATALQPMQVTVQIDVHGSNSADNSQIITTLFRDEYGVTQFATSGFDVSPLYAGEPKQIPYLNGEQQMEERWSIDAVMQTNPIITISQDFAASLTVALVSVDAAYPA